MDIDLVHELEQKELTKNWTEITMEVLPLCDYCKLEAARYDGETVSKRWAYMCDDCFSIFASVRLKRGLGIGIGQRLVEG